MSAIAVIAQATQPSVHTGIPSWMLGLATLIIGTVLGTWLKYYFDRRSKRAAVRCSATYCRDLLTPSAQGVGSDLEIRLSGHSLSNPVVINYHVESIGNVAVNDLNMRVAASDADKIIRWQFYVNQCVQCERLHVIEANGQLLRFKWTYLNPGDSLTLVLLVTPCTDAKCMRLELDAKDVEIKHDTMREDCMVLR